MKLIHLYFLLNKFSSFLDFESSEDHSFTEIVLSMEITRVDFYSSSKKLFDAVDRNSYRFELIHEYFNDLFNLLSYYMIVISWIFLENYKHTYLSI